MIINFTHENQLTVKRVYGQSMVDIGSICYDSRNVQKNTAFVCIRGELQDGHAYIKDALDKEASVIIGTDHTILSSMAANFPDRTFVVVKDAKAALARLSITFYQHAYKNLTSIGVTGTNGKTTVVAYIYSLLNQIGISTGSIGTVGTLSSVGPLKIQQTTPTTPEAPEIHQIFHQFHYMKERAAVMEVTSIAIEQKRVEGILFDIGVHTNITSEHLEFHKTFENYKRAKLKLFRQAKKAVVNLDDKGMAKDILRMYQGPLFTYSIDNHPKADVIAANIRTRKEGTAFQLSINGVSSLVHTPVIGEYNISNLLAAICTAMHMGIPAKSILDALPKIKGPKGRFQLVETPGNYRVLFDYAHTPDALRKLLAEVKKLDYRKLILMVTGVGIRDENKIPKMGEAADGQADEYVISVDHPGYKKPADIVDGVLSGFSGTPHGRITRTYTRAEGVTAALSLAEESDLIVLTGGCINGCQMVKGKALPHSDESIIEDYFTRSINKAKYKIEPKAEKSPVL
ncbi:UDP-N-acetylmuramoyl-L-alanyl-D-glutamate--2,6-diaminopimelate ligase [Virgibacillus senegalensis]|uniref:UDP-N-acetylmuramoyl-L-alanyl-D-glutamate--2, 6-diaminopimelate ligase n=1 Tax=Virgibacillus senegalensis TaxID=1499679 RepID=UPI00069ED117|nr:UDP-N-acetylmuramoyl-L-alanyl-D-glutamate--2,6-diaminopimelate ligase [Virgibacillus senegalensis]